MLLILDIEDKKIIYQVVFLFSPFGKNMWEQMIKGNTAINLEEFIDPARWATEKRCKAEERRYLS